MEVWEAVVLGLVQGLTEFLPVSSSGHLQIFNTLFGLQGEENLTFAVAVHAATVCSTIVVFRNELARLIAGFFRFQWNDETIYICKIMLSMVPVAIVGFFFKDYGGTFRIRIVGRGDFVADYGCAVVFRLLRPSPAESGNFVQGCFRNRARAGFRGDPARSFAFGSTISTGLMLGDRKEEVARFSFLMVLIPILGEAFLDAMKGGFHPSESGISAVALLAGFVTAFVSGFIACRWMIGIVKRGKLIYFAVYCLLVGAASIVYSLV